MSDPRYWGEGTPFETEADHKAAWAYMEGNHPDCDPSNPRIYLLKLSTILSQSGLGGKRENHPVIQAIAPTIDEMVREIERLRASNAALIAALKSVMVRIAFIGWPNESQWESSPGHTMPDWRKEIGQIEAALALATVAQREGE